MGTVRHRPYQRVIYTSGGPVQTIQLPAVQRGGGGGGVGGAYRRALNKANRKNEERYKDILQGYDDLHDRTMTGLEGQGTTARTDIAQRYNNMGAQGYNTLVNRGFGNSSLLGTMRQGVERERTRSLQGLDESLARQRVGYDSAITQGKLGVMERRTDAGPDLNQMIALSQGMGRYGNMPSGGFNPYLGVNNYLQNAYAQNMRNVYAAATFQRPGVAGGGWMANQRARNARARELRAGRNATRNALNMQFADQTRIALRDANQAKRQAFMAEQQKIHFGS